MGNRKNRFISSILKVSFSNLVSLFSGIIVGFLVPKMMGLEGYANYKVYTLYLTYLALLSLGVGDGLYLKFSGTDKEALNVEQIKSYLHKYYIQLSVFASVSIIGALAFSGGEYRFIIMALALVIVSSQITAIHQNLSIITMRFNEYSTRVVTKSILSSILVLVLFAVYCFNGNEISYKLYVGGVVVIDYILAIWYVWSYKEFNSGKVSSKINYDIRYTDLILIGFPLLLSNMAGTIFLNLDRQFVSILFEKEDYAIYAFAYNMLTLITTMTSAVSIVLFPSLKKQENIQIKSSFESHFMLFSMIVPLMLLIYYPLCMVVTVFLPKYYLSLTILRIVLPGVMLSASVSVIFINYYKMENKVQTYFLKTVICIVLSAGLNYAAYVLTKKYEWISWASIGSLLIWYLMALFYFIRKYGIAWKRNFTYIVSSMALFYFVTGIIENQVVSGICYCICVLVLLIIMYQKEVMGLIKKR